MRNSEPVAEHTDGGKLFLTDVEQTPRNMRHKSKKLKVQLKLIKAIVIKAGCYGAVPAVVISSWASRIRNTANPYGLDLIPRNLSIIHSAVLVRQGQKSNGKAYHCSMTGIPTISTFCYSWVWLYTLLFRGLFMGMELVLPSATLDTIWVSGKQCLLF